MFDFERICLSHQIAQLAKAEGSRIEVGSQVGKLLSYFPQSSLSICVMTFLMMGVAALGG